MKLIPLIFSAWLSLAIVMSFFWLIAKKTNKAVVIDLAWTYSLGLIPLFYALLGNFQWGMNTLICITLPLLWSLRLGYHIFQRIIKEGEDARYQEMRDRWGGGIEIKMFYIYQFQALTVIVLSLPYLVLLNGNKHLSLIPTILGLIIAVIAILGESIADKQLRQFKQNNRKQKAVCSTGLWRFSRHPNYFFEWLYWFSFPVISIGLNYWYVSLIGPLVMFYFLTQLSGIPITERHSIKKRGQAYIDYKERTNSFFPWFPKRNKI